MFSVDTLHTYTYTLVNKDQTGADFTDEQFNAVLPDSVIALIEQYFGRPKWKNVQPYLTNERDQAIKDYIANSEIRISKNLTPVAGVITLPADYFHLTGLAYQYITVQEFVCPHCGCVKCSCVRLPKGFKKGLPKDCRVKKRNVKRVVDVVVVGDGQWSQLFQSNLVYPTKEYPFARYIGTNQLEIAPQDIPMVRLDYLRYPAEAHWGYTTAGGFNTYDPNTSVNVELPRVLLKELAAILLAAMGFHTREYWLQQVANQENISGT